MRGARSYCIEFVDLLGAVGQGGQRYRVVESLSVDVVPAHQHHGRGGGERVQGQPREFLAVVLHLVLTAGVKLPRDAVEGGARAAPDI